MLADEAGRQALHCIRCSACLNSCPVYSRTGGHAYESVYPGPIGAILTPQLQGLDQAPTLPWASSLCGACYEVCPVKIDIPTVLVHLRGRVVGEVKSRWSPERLAMDALAKVFGSRGRYERAQRLARVGNGPLARTLPGPSGVDGDARAARGPAADRSASGGPSGGGMSARARDPRPDPGRARRRRRRAGVPRDYHVAGSGPAAGSERVVARFCERAADYRATVRRIAAAEVEDAVAAACREHGARRLAVPPGAPYDLAGLELLVDDPPISARGLDQVDGVLTGCALAIAETGTVVLDGGDLAAAAR